MINVGEKPITHRVCLAEGALMAKPSTLEAIQQGRLPKGNPLPLAEAAGILAVKKTSEILPLCHPLSIDAATVHFEFSKSSISVRCEVSAHARTGVEMEALSGVSAALLCIYDLTKGIDPELEIGGIRLLEKRGGKTGIWMRGSAPPSQPAPKELIPGVRAAVLTLSDRCARGESQDGSGPALCGFLKEAGLGSVEKKILPDDRETLKLQITQLVEEGFDLVVTTGGTGVGPRDITPETLAALPGKKIPGFGELIRSSGLKHTPLSPLSRAEAYLIDKTLVISVPGSEKGALESIHAIWHLVPHTLTIIKGANHS